MLGHFETQKNHKCVMIMDTRKTHHSRMVKGKSDASVKHDQRAVKIGCRGKLTYWRLSTCRAKGCQRGFRVSEIGKDFIDRQRYLAFLPQ